MKLNSRGDAVPPHGGSGEWAVAVAFSGKQTTVLSVQVV